MVKNLLENFLKDPREYELSEKLWNDMWQRIGRTIRNSDTWRTSWLGTGSPDIKDGNPIFSAVSPVFRRGIRVIQSEPFQSGLDFQIWFDVHGEDEEDPESINELVIACTLSDVAANLAETCMMDWVSGKPLTFERDGGVRLVPKTSSKTSVEYRLTGIQAA